MVRSKLLPSLFTVLLVCAFGTMSFAKPAQKKCAFDGNYSFFFWDPADPVYGVGYITVQGDAATQCRSGTVLPGGILNCNFAKGGIFEDFIESGSVFLETDGEGTMLIETNSSAGICNTGVDAIELDISVVLGGKTVLFNSDGEEFAGSGLIPQAGYDATFTGRADKCFAGQISGCYDRRFWSTSIEIDGGVVIPDQPEIDPPVGDCTICVNGAGGVTGGTCRCNIGRTLEGRGFETLSEIEGGGYKLGENCQSSTG